MKCLVTGGLGFIGSNLVQELVKNNEVTIVDNQSTSRPDWKEVIDKNVEVIKECYGSDLLYERISRGDFEVIFHLAAIPRVLYSVENPYETTDINISKTVRLVEAATKGKVKRFVFSSSSSVYGGADIMPTKPDHPKDPKSPYAWQKSAIEDFLKITSSLHGLDAVCLRYFNVFGPGQFGGSAYSTAVSAWCHAIKNGKSLRKDGTGEQSRDMCYVDNVVQANVLAMNSTKSFTGQAYNIACGDRTSNNEILEFFNKRYSNLVIDHAPFRPGDVMHTQADISDTETDLGYVPKVRFWEGLERTLGWWGIN